MKRGSKLGKPVVLRLKHAVFAQITAATTRRKEVVPVGRRGAIHCGRTLTRLVCSSARLRENNLPDQVDEGCVA